MYAKELEQILAIAAPALGERACNSLHTQSDI